MVGADVAAPEIQLENNLGDRWTAHHRPPLIKRKLTLMSDKGAPTKNFRVFRRAKSARGPATRFCAVWGWRMGDPRRALRFAPRLANERAQAVGEKLCLILTPRVDGGFLQRLFDLPPAARVGHPGFHRDHETLQPVAYHSKPPESVPGRVSIVVDPMPTTGESAAAAVQVIKDAGARDVRWPVRSRARRPFAKPIPMCQSTLP